MLDLGCVGVYNIHLYIPDQAPIKYITHPYTPDQAGRDRVVPLLLPRRRWHGRPGALQGPPPGEEVPRVRAGGFQSAAVCSASYGRGAFRWVVIVVLDR